MRTSVADISGSLLSKEAQDRLIWLENNCGKNYPDLQKLILSHGGHSVCIYYEGDCDKIMQRGELFSGQDALLRKGQPIQCHANSARLWSRHKHYKLCTGYALSLDSDGIELWRQHSWCLNKDGVVVETTVKRLKYFGFIMTDEEAEHFEIQNM